MHIDIIVNGYNGYLIDNRNEHEMAKTVLRLLNDRQKLNELSRNARFTKNALLAIDQTFRLNPVS